MSSCNGCKINSVALGLAFGVLWGVAILLVGLAATYYTYGQDFVTTMGSVFPGYTPSVKGSFLGAIIGFIDAFIMAFIIAWLYNKFNGCNCVCSEKKDKVIKVK
jgi:hypothetical protein